jgi:hypothetical protein
MGKEKENFLKIIFVFYCSLKEASLSIMEKYGSQLIKIIKFRDSFVMIGQKGLARGKAIEMVSALPENNSVSRGTRNNVVSVEIVPLL